MPKIRQPYGEPRDVPWLGRTVRPGEVVTVPEADLASYLEAGWEPVDATTHARAAQLRADGVVTVGGEPADGPLPVVLAPGETVVRAGQADAPVKED